MVEIVKADKSGRIVIPRSIRRELGMEKGGQFPQFGGPSGIRTRDLSLAKRALYR